MLAMCTELGFTAAADAADPGIINVSLDLVQSLHATGPNLPPLTE
jgi:hypothetical protein